MCVKQVPTSLPWAHSRSTWWSGRSSSLPWTIFQWRGIRWTCRTRSTSLLDGDTWIARKNLFYVDLCLRDHFIFLLFLWLLPGPDYPSIIMFDVVPLVTIQRYSPVKEDQFLLPQNNECGVSQLWNLGGDEEPSPEGGDLLHQQWVSCFSCFLFAGSL